MQRHRFPVSIRRGSVITRIYRLKRGDGREVFTASWNIGGKRETRQFSTYISAHAEATLKAEQLAAGRLGAAALTVDDAGTLTAIRDLCGAVPPLAAMQEWAKARKLCGGSILPAVEAWAATHTSKVKSVTLVTAIDDFISKKGRNKRQGERTYRSKLKPLLEFFKGDTALDAITVEQLDRYLEQPRFADTTTRNDYRKRAVTLWRWAQKAKHLPSGVPLAIEETDRLEEDPTEIGIIGAATYRRLLEFIRAHHPEHLAALIIAGFCGVRSDEIHGKRANRNLRQTWEDVHLDRKSLYVTVAKRNTPSYREVPVCDAAREWLLLCPNRKGAVCEAGAMEKVRLIARGAKFDLPENCLRHSFISYRVAVTQNKAQVALEAGNSIKVVDRHYRKPVSAVEAAAWFDIRPAQTGKLVGMDGKEVAS